MNLAAGAPILKLALAAPAARGQEGGLSVSHCPAMRSDSRRAWSPGSPPPQRPSRSHKGPLRKFPTPLPQTLGPLGETVLWGQGPSGLPPGPPPRPGRRQLASAMSVKSHRGQQSVPREGAFRLPESLGGQWRVTRIQWVKLSQAVWLGV